MRVRILQVLLMALALVIAVPSMAQAASKYAGSMDRGGKVTFKVTKDGPDRFVVDFLGTHQKADCDQGQIRVFGGWTGEVPANPDGSFEFHGVGTGESAGDTVDVVGKLKAKGKAKGTFDEHLEDPTYDGDPYSNCSTGTLDWKAKRR